jgi:hypothetical protein
VRRGLHELYSDVLLTRVAGTSFTEPVNPSTADLGSSPALGTIKSTGNDPERAHDCVRAYVLC